MNKSQLIDALAARFEGNRKVASHALESVLDTITREVAKGEKVAITGFGSFEKRIRDARWVRNPSTGARMKAKKKAVPAFKPGAQLKDVVSGAKKLPKLTFAAVEKAAPQAAKPAVRRTAAAAERAVGGGGTAKKTAAKKAPGQAGRSGEEDGCQEGSGQEGSGREEGHASEEDGCQEGSGREEGHAGEEHGCCEEGSRARRPPAKKAPAKKAPAKKAPAKKTAAKKS